MKKPSSIPLYDFSAQHKPLQKDMEKAVLKVLRGGQFVLGAEGAAFEAAFAALHQARFGVGVSSGTSALHLALLALEVGPGDAVLTSPFTFIGTTIAAVAAGAQVQFADIDPATLTLDPAEAERRVTPKTKALLPVHLYGWPADMGPLRDLAQRKKLRIVEDCAQAHLTEYKGRKVGALGDIGCFSFYVTKNLGAMGDAGACVTNDPDLDQRLRVLRNNGSDLKEKYRHPLKGHNARLDEIQAAILRVKLKRLERWTADRRKTAALYRKALADLPVTLPPADAKGNVHTYHLFTIRAQNRDALKAHLAEKGVSAGVYYPIPLHLQPAYKDFGHKEGDFPRAEQACREVLTLPLYPGLSASQAHRVADAVRSFFKK